MQLPVGVALKLFRVQGGDVTFGGMTKKDLKDEEAYSPKAWKWLQEQLNFSRKRKENYDLYEVMDETDLPNSVVELYAEDATQPDLDTGKTVWIKSADKNIENAGNEMLEALAIEDEIAGICRSMCLMGDDFERTVYQSGKGLMALRYVHPKRMTRKEDKFKKLKGYYQDGQRFRKAKESLSYPWDYVHFRLRFRDREWPYGTSILYGARRPWRALLLAEDAALMYRLSRHPDRNVYWVDVGNNQDQATSWRIAHEFRKRIKKQEVIDPTSRDYRQQFNPASPLEDIILPIWSGSSSRVDRLPGSANVGEVYDLNYFLNKFFSAVRAPKAYFGFEGDIQRKSTLANQDVRYARTVKRIQRALRFGLRYMTEIHLTLLERDVESTKYDWREEGRDFQVMMSTISYLDELERLELLQLKTNVALGMLTITGQPALDAYNWTVYILQTFMGLDKAEIDKIAKKLPAGSTGGGGRFGGRGFESSDQEQETLGKEAEKIISREGALSPDEEKKVVALIERHPELQRLIHLGRGLFAPDGDIHGYKPEDVPQFAEVGADLEDDFKLEEDYGEEEEVSRE